ncbi:Bis(5'-nucleosyl)-tetraphosphatase PrpE [asymmetrical] [Roseibium album]|nr:Bis(5'-nucleosyl)-tetraphosphatase PrpE [asymmetrical] [Roseibium album]
MSGNTEKTITYAIGDVHGMSELLDDLWAQIRDHAATREAIPVPIFLGDLVDRGPGNIEVMDLVSEILSTQPKSRLILGNHDEYFFRFLTGTLDQKHRDLWLTYGGLATIKSYEIDMEANETTEANRIKAKYPQHYKMLSDAVSCVVLDKFILVHAGVRPGIPLSEQEPQDMRWIREPFLSSKENFEKIVVHGHTITGSGSPEAFQNRIAIDTGAFKNKRLSAMVISGGPDPQETEYEFITVTC